MTSTYLAADLRRDEGVRLQAYPDTGDVWTIGVGHTGPEVVHGLCWTRAACDHALAQDIARVERGLDARLPWWRTLDEPRQDVLANMAFNLGVGELCAWRHTLHAVQTRDYASAAAHMLGSEPWRTQVGARAERLAEQMRTGERSGP